MLMQTLDALAALDYPDFEVLVIDNNTKDPAVWQPVEAHCQNSARAFAFTTSRPWQVLKAARSITFCLLPPRCQKWWR